MKAITALLTSFFCFISSATGFFSGQVDTVKSVTKLADKVYMVDCQFDYDIDRMMKEGIDNHVELVLNGVGQLASGLKGFGCTTFNSVTKSGDYLLSRNFDYMGDGLLILWTHPKNGYKSVSMTLPSFVGYFGDAVPHNDIRGALTVIAPYAPLDGINEKGLCVGVLEVEKAPVFQMTARPNLTTTSMVRAVLDKAATVDEAIKIFKSYDMRDFLFGGCSYHYHVSDASGKSVVIEYVKGKMNVIYPEKRKGAAVDYIAAANYYLTPGVKDPKGMGWDRTDTVYAALKKTGGITSEKQAMKILKSASMKDADLHGYICTTLWSAVYNSSKKTVDLCYMLNYGKTYTFSPLKPLAVG